MNYYEAELNKLALTGIVNVAFSDSEGNKTKHMDVNVESLGALKEFLTKIEKSICKFRITYVKTAQVQVSDGVIDSIRSNIGIESEGQDSATITRENLISYLDEKEQADNYNLYKTLQKIYDSIEGEFDLVYFYN